MAVAVDSTVEIDTDLHHNAVNVLLYIYDQDDETATTTEIKNATGLSSANISGGHAQELECRGLIEQAGSVESKAPINTNVYTLTHRGRKEAKRLLNETEAEVPMPEGEKLALLNLLKERADDLDRVNEPDGQTTSVSEDELRDLREEVNEIREQLEDLSRTAESHEKRIDDHSSSLDRVFNILKKIRTD